MAENTDQKTPVSITDVDISLSGSDRAPILFFERASALGYFEGIVRVTLEAQRLYPGTNGPAATLDRVIVAHLRMSQPAALSLKAALDQALLLMAPAESQSKN